MICNVCHLYIYIYKYLYIFIPLYIYITYIIYADGSYGKRNVSYDAEASAGRHAGVAAEHAATPAKPAARCATNAAADGPTATTTNSSLATRIVEL